MLNVFLSIAAICSIPFVSIAQKATFKRTPHGVTLTFNNVPTAIDQTIAITFVRDSIVHIKATPLPYTVQSSAALAITDSLVNSTTTIALNEKEQSLLLSTKALLLSVSLLSGKIDFLTPQGDTILCEQSRNSESFIPALANGDPFYQIQQKFRVDPNEGLYGLGQHQNGIMNYQGHQVTLLQYNTEVAVPFMISTKNYGILWNNYSITKVGDTRPLLPLSGLKLYAKTGEEGWLTASYINKIDEKQVLLTRAESDIAYNDLTDAYKFPDSINLANSLVRYEGQLSSPYSGTHRFYFKYAGYIKVWLDDKLVQDRWRESWNAGTFEIDLHTVAHQKHRLRIDWQPMGAISYLGVNWQRPIANAHTFAFNSEAGDGIDYYFIKGQHMDHVIGGYRTLTGRAPIMPKWAFGYWQSRERYKTQEEILTIANEFRKRKIPIDNLVLDWSYWPEKDWGGQNFDTTRFPDATAMIRELHRQHYHFMISTWPKFNETSTTYPEFMKNGWLYKRNIADRRKDWIGKGYISTFYDPFNNDARKAFWDLLNKKLYQKGVDAFWMDASEPDIHSNISIQERKDVFQPSTGSSTRYYNAFPLQNAKGIYEGQRKEAPNKRVFMLTRSGFAGQQRYAAATWSGDIAATWDDMRDQIAAGVNFSMSGLPYWTMDAGGFLVENRYYKPNKANQEEWRELNSRWYQFAAFLPIFRAHGQYPFREPFNIAPQGHPAYSSMLYSISLRYRLLPYIYSLAGKTYLQNYTMLRGLSMDFSTDTAVYNINDQFMLGQSLLVNPVTKKGATVRTVYLPKASKWYNLYNGHAFNGAQYIQADAPYERTPVFVPAGTILPIGQVMQYVDEQVDTPITLYVYEGADGSFTLYEDDGQSYQYEKGAYSTISFHYNNQHKTLTLGERRGQYKNMPLKRQFQIVFVSKTRPVGIDAPLKHIKTIRYEGKRIAIQLAERTKIQNK